MRRRPETDGNDRTCWSTPRVKFTPWGEQGHEAALSRDGDNAFAQRTRQIDQAADSEKNLRNLNVIRGVAHAALWPTVTRATADRRSVSTWHAPQVRVQVDIAGRAPSSVVD
jgi:hypothetical protein